MIVNNYSFLTIPSIPRYERVILSNLSRRYQRIHIILHYRTVVFKMLITVYSQLIDECFYCSRYFARIIPVDQISTGKLIMIIEQFHLYQLIGKILVSVNDCKQLLFSYYSINPSIRTSNTFKSIKTLSTHTHHLAL